MSSPLPRRVVSARAFAAVALLAALVAMALAPGDAGATSADGQVAASAGSEMASALFATSVPSAPERAVTERSMTERVVTQRALPMSAAVMLLLDEARGRAYIAGDSSVLVMSLAGTLLQTVALPSAGEMVIVGDDLFVAQATLGSIARISLTTLTVGTPLVTGLTDNRSLAFAGGALWTTSGECRTHASRIVRVQVSDGTTTTFADPESGYGGGYYCPVLTGRDDQLVVATRTNASTVHLFDLSSGSPVFVVAGRLDVDPGDMSINAAGDVLYVAAGYPYVGQTLLLPTLVPGPVYAATNYPRAIAHTPSNGGLVAVGNSHGDPNLRLLDVGNPTTPRWSLQLGDSIVSHGLAFSASGTVLYALSADGPAVTLNVIDVADPTLPPPTTAPPTTAPPTTAPPSASQFGEFHALDPQRVYDSRDYGQRVSETPVQITGRGGVPATGVSAVAVNVTVTEPESDGYLTVYPAGQAPPATSTLNYTAGRTIPNMAIVGVGTGGQLGLFALTPTHVIVDVVGWFGAADAPSGTLFHPIVPFRWFDTRTDARGDGVVRPVGPGQWVFSSGTGNRPTQTAGVTAVAMNVTAANTTESSYLSVTPYGAPLGSSNLNWTAGEIVPNAVISKLDAAQGRVQFTNAYGSTDVIADSSGYWDAGTSANGLRFTPITPRRMADTRSGFLAPGSVMQQTFRVAPGSFISFKANAGLSSGASTAVLNVTAVNPDTDGFLSVFPLGMPYADGIKTSVVNFTAGSVRPNMTIMPMGAGGEIMVVNGSGAAVDIVVDMTGYFG